MEKLDVVNAALGALKAGKTCELVVVAGTAGSSPRGVGASMAVFADGSQEGTIGGGKIELFALDEARELAALIQDQHGHVNLIPVNPIKERSYVQSGRKAIEAFKGCLESKGINVTIRREMGRDIDGACGQLRKSYMDKEQEKEGAAVK